MVLPLFAPGEGVNVLDIAPEVVPDNVILSQSTVVDPELVQHPIVVVRERIGEFSRCNETVRNEGDSQCCVP